MSATNFLGCLHNGSVQWLLLRTLLCALKWELSRGRICTTSDLENFFPFFFSPNTHTIDRKLSREAYRSGIGLMAYLWKSPPYGATIWHTPRGQWISLQESMGNVPKSSTKSKRQS